jgi:hypothetical protein
VKSYKNILFCVLAGLTLESGCSSKGGSGDTNIDVNEQLNEVQTSLSQVGIKYTGGREKAFIGENQVFIPCDENVTLNLNQSVEKLSYLNQRLIEENRLDDSIRVREQFLDRLTPLKKELDEYCAIDSQKIQSCLDQNAKVYVVLNQKSTGAEPVSPIVVPLNVKDLTRNKIEIGIYRSSRQSNSSRSPGFTEIERGISHPKTLERETREYFARSVDSLSQSGKCFAEQSFESETARTIQKLIEAASTERY